MEKREFLLWKVGLVFLALIDGSSATLSPSGVNYEVVALMSIKTDLNDPYNVLENWDANSVDPCSWRMITCSQDGYVSALGLPSGLSGRLSPGIGNLTNLQSVLLQNNDISGPIPAVIGTLEKLHTLDLSNNKFIGGIPSSLGDLKNLNYLRLNNNSLSGPIPDSLSNVKGLTLVDLSFNNLSGSVPKISARTFKIVGNPSICGQSSKNNCSVVYPEPLSFPPDTVKDHSESGGKSHIAVAFGTSFGAAFLIVIVIGLLVWWRYRRNQQIFFDVNGNFSITLFVYR
ncbi:Protein NSP-INTERACTING KINASE 3 [Forsythia ovata]|uniref:Protein NSP-INTERACTING KINASE 3 n=1 Tax=Forsythia ovata TaxID=205694 RepID=A0ABD1XD94_9LAMI